MSNSTGLYHTLIDFLLPQTCILCSKETPHTLICDNCLNYLPIVQSPVCSLCGRPADERRICTYCKKDPLVDHGRSWLSFVPPVNTLIHHFKYRRKTHLATLLGGAMASIILSDPVLQRADLIVPVPLFWLKRLHRGYNQSALLCAVIAKNTGLIQQNVLRRTRHTRTQTKLTESNRRKNVTNAFAVTKDYVNKKYVLVIDDVMTTGATMNECARVLKQAGAKEVYSCVAAITPSPSSPSLSAPPS